MALIQRFGVLGTSLRKLVRVVRDVATDSRASATLRIAAGPVSFAWEHFLWTPVEVGDTEGACPRFGTRGVCEIGADWCKFESDNEASK